MVGDLLLGLKLELPLGRELSDLGAHHNGRLTIFCFDLQFRVISFRSLRFLRHDRPLTLRAKLLREVERTDYLIS